MTSITLTIRMLIIQSFPLQFFSLYFNSNYCHCLHIQIRHSFTYKSFSFALLTYSRTLGSERKNSCFKAEVHQWQAKISNPFSWIFVRIFLRQSRTNYSASKNLIILPILTLFHTKILFVKRYDQPWIYLKLIFFYQDCFYIFWIDFFAITGTRWQAKL